MGVRRVVQGDHRQDGLASIVAVGLVVGPLVDVQTLGHPVPGGRLLEVDVGRLRGLNYPPNRPEAAVVELHDLVVRRGGQRVDIQHQGGSSDGGVDESLDKCGELSGDVEARYDVGVHEQVPGPEQGEVVAHHLVDLLDRGGQRVVNVHG